jgi:hypothetical protein
MNAWKPRFGSVDRGVSRVREEIGGDLVRELDVGGRYRDRSDKPARILLIDVTSTPRVAPPGRLAYASPDVGDQ